MTDWGTPESVFPSDIKEAYEIPLGDPKHIHAICEEYRAAATVDMEHDSVDRKIHRII